MEMEFELKVTKLGFSDLEAFLADGLMQSNYLELIMEHGSEDYANARLKYMGDPLQVTFEGVLATILLNGKSLEVIDTEEDKTYELTLEKLKNAFNLCLNKDSETFANIVTDNYDYSDMDILLQFALFGEIIYG